MATHSLRAIDHRYMTPLEKLIEEYHDGDWIGTATPSWNDDNTEGYNQAKIDFEKLLNKHKEYKGTAPLPHTFSDKAYVRVVVKIGDLYVTGTNHASLPHAKEFLQSICPVDGKIISEVEVTK